MALSPTSGPTGSGGSGTGVEQSYVEFTASVNITATVEASADVIVTAAAFTADGSSAYLVQFFCPSIVTSNVAGRNVNLWLFQDGSSIGTLLSLQTPAAAALVAPAAPAVRIVPAAGSRTYSVRGTVNAGTGIASAGLGGAGTTRPGYIRITKVT